MSNTAEVSFDSGNKIRNGHMGFVIKLSNSIVNARKNIDSETEHFSDVFTSEWQSFVSGELETSNERNGRSLGGKPTSPDTDDDDTQHFDVNMDNIMKRFKCFTTIMQNNSSTDDEDKDDDDDTGPEPDAEDNADYKA